MMPPPRGPRAQHVTQAGRSVRRVLADPSRARPQHDPCSLCDWAPSAAPRWRPPHSSSWDSIRGPSTRCAWAAALRLALGLLQLPPGSRLAPLGSPRPQR